MISSYSLISRGTRFSLIGMVLLTLACGGEASLQKEEPPPAQSGAGGPWELSFEQEGGIAGFRLSAVIQSSGEAIFRDLRNDRQAQITLAEPDLRLLAQLIEASDFFSQPEDLRTPRCRDCITYTLSLQSGDRVHRIRSDDLGLTEPFRPLVEWLAEHTQRAVQSR